MTPEELEQHELIPAKTRDTTSPVWDMSQERVFIETLLNQRFSFFLVLFSLVIAGAVNAKIQLHLQLILTLGSVITVLFALVIDRAQRKLDLIITDLKTDASHPMAIIDKRAGPAGTKRRLIGFWIPRMCCAVLILAAVLAWANCLQVPPVRP